MLSSLFIVDANIINAAQVIANFSECKNGAKNNYLGVKKNKKTHHK